MYNNGYGPQFNNNPFITDPTNAQSRFPEISDPNAHNPWLQSSSGFNSTGYQSPQMYQQQPQTAPTYSSGSPSYFNQGVPMQQQPTGAPFRPTSNFGQGLAATISGSSYGYLNGQIPTPQNGYQPVQQQLQGNTGYIAQFDPYASVGQGWDGASPPAAQSLNTQNNLSPTYSGFSTSTSPTGNPHPREYLRTHKAEIEAWDSYAWQQLLNSFDGLKASWEGRAKELEEKIGQLQMQLQYGGAYYPAQIQQEQARLQGLLKDAQSHSDSIVASTFQMREVKEGYRQSSDQASKRRVREASNAAVSGLPDWPPQVY